MASELDLSCPDCGKEMLHEQARAGCLCVKCAKFWTYLQMIAARSEAAESKGAVSVLAPEAGAVSRD